mmetsp:Transcript_1774/g.4851  ORF Transcript_1774/g.4851 Transcript_1774/m.4851 type:complete len:437 (-) Transcript_1774:18-1328(-)
MLCACRLFIRKLESHQLLRVSLFLYIDADPLQSQHTLDGGNGATGLGLQAVNGDGTGGGNLGFVLVLGHEGCHGHSASFNHGFFGLANPNAGIVKLLVGFVVTGGVANLSLQKVVLVLFKGADTVPVGPLGVGIDIHLDDTIVDGRLDFFVGRTGTSVHDQKDWLFHVRLELFLGVGLVLAEAFGLEADIAGLVDSVDIAKGGGNGEHVGNFGKSLVDIPHLFGAGVQLVGVGIFIVDAIFFSARDSNFHFQPNVHLGHAFKVLGADFDILFIGFFGKIQHVHGEQGFAVLLEEFFIGIQHGIEPGEQLFGAVIRVEDDGDAVVGSHETNVHGEGHGSGGAVVGVLDSLSGVKRSTAVGHLDHDGRVVFAGGFHDGIADGGTGAVKGRNGISGILGVSQQLDQVGTGHNAGSNVGDSTHDWFGLVWLVGWSRVLLK